VITIYGRGPGLTAVVPVTPAHWSVPIPCSRLSGVDRHGAAGRPLTVTWVGDMSLSSELGLPPLGDAGPLAALRGELARGDLTLGNLEGTLGSGGRSKCDPDAKHCVTFRAPALYARLYSSAGFDVLSVANNHAFDYGPKGLRATAAALRGAGIAAAGVPGAPLVRTVAGARVAIVGFAPYAWALDLRDIARARQLVADAARRADLVVVAMHAGAEGADQTHTPVGVERAFGEDRGDTRGFAHAVVDAGADLVLGSGPHVLRGVELYRGRLIAYSLGNFLGYKTLVGGGTLALARSPTVGRALAAAASSSGSETPRSRCDARSRASTVSEYGA
jgi:poly-gamma-glutamate capsule biosynthesis protein CapA/YwtB (metallophosphatase superfamily)